MRKQEIALNFSFEYEIIPASLAIPPKTHIEYRVHVEA
jgi:hypothetical protein